MKTTVLFDLGNTLVAYYGHAQFPQVMSAAMANVETRLRREGLLNADPEHIRLTIPIETKEAPDCHVIPLIERLCRIYQLDRCAIPDGLAEELCAAWLTPVFAMGRLYDDTLPVLRKLRSNGIKTAIVSNTPWGSPGKHWRGELHRLQLTGEVDDIIFCTDAGWRKPARQIFDYTLDRLGESVSNCLFVGDDPRWDIAGPQAIGMDAILIDRTGSADESIAGLEELLFRL